jgi:hypothetical protein
LITRLCPIIISAIIFNRFGSRLAALFFPNFSKHFLTIKTIHNAIIDETGMYGPVGIQHNDLCRQREEQDGGKESAGNADLRPELPASLSSELPSGLLP